MLLSNEPAVYAEGSYGIRLETSLFVKHHADSSYGTFLGFENIAFVPFEREAIDPSLLTAAETNWLNTYHQSVYTNLKPYLTPQEADWLKQATAPL